MTWRRISREEALAAVADDRDGGCLICGLLADRIPEAHVLADGPHARLVLNAFPVRPGHLMVLLREHATRFDQVSAAAWRDANDLARRAAGALERALNPARVYIASLGTSLDDLPQTSPHLHLHVVPVAESDRPREVLTWQHGVWTAEPQVWLALAERVRDALRGS